MMFQNSASAPAPPEGSYNAFINVVDANTQANVTQSVKVNVRKG
jgi:hypothetical protein